MGTEQIYYYLKDAVDNKTLVFDVAYTKDKANVNMQVLSWWQRAEKETAQGLGQATASEDMHGCQRCPGRLGSGAYTLHKLVTWSLVLLQMSPAGSDNGFLPQSVILVSDQFI